MAAQLRLFCRLLYDVLLVAFFLLRDLDLDLLNDAHSLVLHSSSKSTCPLASLPVILLYWFRSLIRRTRTAGRRGMNTSRLSTKYGCLYRVLKTLQTEARRPDLKIFNQDQNANLQLIAAVHGCRDVLDNLDDVLAKYEGLGVRSEASARQRLWQRLRFGSKFEELAVVHGKVIDIDNCCSYRHYTSRGR